MFISRLIKKGYILYHKNAFLTKSIAIIDERIHLPIEIIGSGRP